MKYLYLAFTLLFFCCAKKNPEKHILGRWQVINIDTIYGGEERPDLYEAFKNDLSYFKELTFYEDGLVLFNFLNTTSKIGIYEIEDTSVPRTVAFLKLEHFPLKDTVQTKSYDFSKISFFIKEFNRNKMILHTNVASKNPKHGKGLQFEFTKTGKFEN